MSGRLFLLALGLVGIAMSGCASGGSPQPASQSRLFGLVAGDPAPAKPFVVAARPTAEQAYPAVGVTPAGRHDVILTPAERDALERNLKAAGGRGTKKRRIPAG